jgi:tetratricopeptide (TPR) repeat protein
MYLLVRLKIFESATQSRHLAIFLFVFLLLFYGCTPHNSTSGLTGSETKMLSDSLKTLDSLILHFRVSRPNECVKYAHIANRISHKINTPEAYAKTNILNGNVYFSSRMDSSFYFYHKALLIIDSFQLKEEKGIVFYSLGMLYNAANNFKMSIEYLDSALHYSKVTGDFANVSNSLNALGNTYLELGDEIHAKNLYDSAYHISTLKKLYLQMGTSLGNRIKFETNKKKAIEEYKNAIQWLKRSNGSDEPVALILINIGAAFDNPDSAIFYYQKAINMVQQENAPEVIAIGYNNLAYSYLDKGDFVRAEKCIRDFALPVAQRMNNLDWQWTVYDTYSDVMKKAGNLAKALEYEKKSIDLLGDANKESALKQIRLLAVMLDLKNKESIIKDEKIEIETTKAHLRARNQIILIILLLLILGIAFLFERSQKKKIHLQNQQLASARKIIDAEENEKAKIGRDFHDLTGQKFTIFSEFVENIEFPDKKVKERILEILQDIRATVRELSHRMNRSWLERFSLEMSIRGLCEDIIK